MIKNMFLILPLACVCSSVDITVEYYLINLSINIKMISTTNNPTQIPTSNRLNILIPINRPTIPPISARKRVLSYEGTSVDEVNSNLS